MDKVWGVATNNGGGNKEADDTAMKKLFLILIFLFGISSAFGGSQTKVGKAVGQKAAYWQNVVVDTLGASDDRYAYIYGYDGYDTMYVSDFDFSVSADSSLDSVVFRIEYSRTCEETQVGYNVSTNASGYNILETNDALPTNSSGDTSIYLKYTGFTIAQVNADSFGIIFWLPDGFGGDCTNYIDFVRATAYFHSTAPSCTLGIDSVTVTPITNGKAIFKVYNSCGRDSFRTETDTNATAYGHDSTWVSSDTAGGDTMGGFFVGTWYLRAIVWYNGAADTYTGYWLQPWKVDTVETIGSNWAINSGTQWVSDMEVGGAGIANWDTCIAWYSLSGYNDSTNRMAQSGDYLFSDNFITIPAPDTVYMSGKFKRTLAGETMVSPKKDTFFIATYPVDSILSVAIDSFKNYTDQTDTVKRRITTPAQSFADTIVEVYNFMEPSYDSTGITKGILLVKRPYTANHTDTFSVPIYIYESSRLYITTWTVDYINGIGVWSKPCTTSRYFSGDNLPTGLCVTTWESENRDSSGYGVPDPDTMTPIQLVTETPKFSAILVGLDSAKSCEIIVGTSVGLDNMWHDTLSFSKIIIGQRCPKIPYAGQQIQSGKRYYWKIRFSDGVNWSSWSLSGTFRGVSPTSWANMAYKKRSNIEWNNSHDTIPSYYAHNFSIKTGEGHLVTRRGPSDITGSMAYYNGFTYIAYYRDIDNRPYFAYEIIRYDEITDTWSEPYIFGYISEGDADLNHKPPFLIIGNETYPKLHCIIGDHYDYFSYLHTVGGDSGNGIDITKWKGGGGDVYAKTANTLTDSTKSWGTNEYKSWIVKIVSGAGIGTVETVSTNNGMTLTLKNNWDVQPDTSSRYMLCYKTPAMKGTYPCFAVIDSFWFVFYRHGENNEKHNIAYARHNLNLNDTLWDGPKFVFVYHDPGQSGKSSVYSGVYHSDAYKNKRIHLIAVPWDDYADNATGNRGRAIFYMYSDLDSNGWFTDWYQKESPISVGKTQDNTIHISTTIDYAAVAKIMTCQSPNPSDSNLIGPYIGAANVGGNITSDTFGRPYFTICDYDTVNTNPGDCYLAQYDSAHSTWNIDCLTGATKFVAVDSGNYDYYSVSVKSGTISGKKFILKWSSADSAVYDNIADHNALRNAVNYDNPNGHIKIAYAGIVLPDTTAGPQSFSGGGTRAYSYKKLRASSEPRVWNFRQAGSLCISENYDKVTIYGMVYPGINQYQSGEIRRWDATPIGIGQSYYSRKYLSYNSGYGAGRILTYQRQYPNRFRRLLYTRNTDLYLITDLDYYIDVPKKPNGDDVRIYRGYMSGSNVTWAELPRLPASCWGLDSTGVYFNIGNAVLKDSTYVNNYIYQCYYDCDTATTPESKIITPDSIFKYHSSGGLFESFESVASNTNLDSVTNWDVTGSGSARIYSYYDTQNWTNASTDKLTQGINFLRAYGNTVCSKNLVAATTNGREFDVDVRINSNFGGSSINGRAYMRLEFPNVYYSYRSGTANSGGTGWSNLDSIYASDNKRAKYYGTSQTIAVVNGFNFNIPYYRIIGIRVSVEGYGASGNSTNRKFKVGLTVDGSTIKGTWKTGTLEVSDATLTFGDSTDLWGSAFSYFQINNSSFGVLLVDNDAVADTLYFDQVMIQIYTAPYMNYISFGISPNAGDDARPAYRYSYSWTPEDTLWHLDSLNLSSALYYHLRLCLSDGNSQIKGYLNDSLIFTKTLVGDFSNPEKILLVTENVSDTIDVCWDKLYATGYIDNKPTITTTPAQSLGASRRRKIINEGE